MKRTSPWFWVLTLSGLLAGGGCRSGSSNWVIRGEATGLFANATDFRCFTQTLNGIREVYVTMEDDTAGVSDRVEWEFSFRVPLQPDRQLYPVVVTPPGFTNIDGQNYGGLGVISGGEAFFIHELRVPPNPALGLDPLFTAESRVERMVLSCGEGGELDVRDLPFPVDMTTTLDERLVLKEGFAGRSGALHAFATPRSLYTIEASTGGFSEDLGPAAATMPTMDRRDAPEGPDVPMPLPPPFENLGLAEAIEMYGTLDTAVPLRTFEPDALALAWNGLIYYFNGSSWTTHATTVSDLETVLAVYPDHLVTIWGDVLGGDAPVSLTGGFQLEGPLRSDGAWTWYTDASQRLCGAIDRFDGTRQEVGCADVDFGVFANTPMGGSSERAVLLAQEVGGDWKRWVSFTEQGVTVEDWPVPGEPFQFPSDEDTFDIPNDDRVRWGRGVWYEPETGSFVTPPPTQGIEVPCETPATTAEERSEPWCQGRTIDPREGDRFSFPPDTAWSVPAESVDLTTRFLAQRSTSEPIPASSLPPLVSTPVSRSGSIQVPQIPGMGPLPMECVEVRDGEGLVVQPDENGTYELFFSQTYELVVLPCDLGDGGPPVLGYRIPVQPQVPEGLWVDQIGRAWPVDPADEPPLQLFDPEVQTLVLREATSWNALSITDAGLERLDLGPSSSAAPMILPGPRYLTAAGTLVDADSSQSVDLDLDPADTRYLQGRYLVEESPSRLRVHDLSIDPVVTLIDEEGQREAHLLATSEDGSVVIEQMPNGAIDLRQRTTGMLTRLGSYPIGDAVFADLSADGALGVVSSARSTFPGRRVFTVRVDGGVVSADTLCESCGPHAFLERGSERYVYTLDGHLRDLGDAFETLSTPTDRVPAVAHRVDPYGWLWNRPSSSVFPSGSALDLADPSSFTTMPMSFPTETYETGLGNTWSLTATSWSRLTGPNTWTPVPPRVFRDGLAAGPVVGPEAPTEPATFVIPCQIVAFHPGVASEVVYGCSD